MKIIFKTIKTENQYLFTNKTISVSIKREDLIHPIVSGNKYRKLKYNILEAQRLKYNRIITFGGAYSNHIAAVAYAGLQNGLKTIGIIRGDELENKVQENPTLKFAQECGMVFEFVSREQYQNKNDNAFNDYLKLKYKEYYIIPEGGTNELAIKGCEEILTNDDKIFDYICTCVGTGGTIAGIINASNKHQKILGFQSLKGDFLQEIIIKFTNNKSNWQLIKDYDFGGYAKVTDDLVLFMNDFYKIYKILLDPIYTAKMVFGVVDLINNNYFPENSKVLIIHTGGLQGIQGVNNIRLKKHKILINTDV